MKNKKAMFKVCKILLAFAFLLIIPTVATSQTNQIGLRIGDLSGLSYRYTNDKKLSLEVNIQKWLPYSHGSILSVLGEKNWPLKNNFTAYAGGGLFISSLRVDRYYPYRNGYYYREVDTGPNWGIEGVGGIEYKFKEAPFIIGVDVRPRVWGFIYPNFWDGGVNLRYVF